MQLLAEADDVGRADAGAAQGAGRIRARFDRDEDEHAGDQDHWDRPQQAAEGVEEHRSRSLNASRGHHLTAVPPSSRFVTYFTEKSYMFSNPPPGAFVKSPTGPSNLSVRMT